MDESIDIRECWPKANLLAGNYIAVGVDAGLIFGLFLEGDVHENVCEWCTHGVPEGAQLVIALNYYEHEINPITIFVFCHESFPLSDYPVAQIPLLTPRFEQRRCA